MRKLLLVVLMGLSLTQLKAQKAVVFKIKYLPSHNYNTTVNIGVKLKVNITGDQQTIDKLTALGLTVPLDADLVIGVGGLMKTGALGTDNTIPINMDYKLNNISVSANGKQFPIPPKATEKDMKLIGHISQDWQLKLDSADGKKVVDSTEKKMQQMMSLIQKEIKFPDKPLMPGDTFTQGTPMDIPVGKDNIIHLDAGVTYKLVSISDGKAYFDMVPILAMNFKIKDLSISFTGSGTGKLVYSIKDSFPLSKEGDFNIKIKVSSDKINVDGTGVITTNYNCEIN